MTQGNYGHIKTANSKAPLFMVAVGTVLIEHEIIDPKDRTTRTAISNYGQLSKTDRQRVKERSNNRVILWNDVLNYLGE